MANMELLTYGKKDTFALGLVIPTFITGILVAATQLKPLPSISPAILWFVTGGFLVISFYYVYRSNRRTYSAYRHSLKIICFVYAIYLLISIVGGVSLFSIRQLALQKPVLGFLEELPSLSTAIGSYTIALSVTSWESLVAPTYADSNFKAKAEELLRAYEKVSVRLTESNTTLLITNAEELSEIFENGQLARERELGTGLQEWVNFANSTENMTLLELIIFGRDQNGDPLISDRLNTLHGHFDAVIQELRSMVKTDNGFSK